MAIHILLHEIFKHSEINKLVLAIIWKHFRDFSPYYQSTQETEYICTKRDNSGMHFCDALPVYKDGNKTCNLTYEEYQMNMNGCINWNQYYSICKEGGENPFQGTISFDNIGLAWVAIFLVC